MLDHEPGPREPSPAEAAAREPSPDLRAAKAEARRVAFAKRDALDPLVRESAAHALAAVRLPFEPFPVARVVAGFLPIRSEVDARPLMLRLLEAGAWLALPVVDHPRLRFLSWRFGEPLHPAGFGTVGPAADARELDPVAMLVPLAAFDRQGGRLGYGAGHYDRAVAALRAKAPVLTVGLAFAAQEVERVPTGPRDERLDYVLTEEGLIACGAGR